MEDERPEAASPEPVWLDADAPVPVEPAAPAEPPPLPRPGVASLVRDALLDLFAALGTSLVLVLVIAAVAVISGLWEFDDLQTSALSVTSLVLLLVAVQLPLLIFGARRLRRNRQKGRPPLALFEGNALLGAARGAGAGLLLAVASALYSLLVQSALGEDSVPRQLDFLKQLLGDPRAVTALTVIIAGLAPVCEELFFRGAIFGAANAAGHARAGAAISAALFATVHFSLVLAPFYALFALVMCWLLARTGTLAAPIAAHMTMNGLACLSIVLLGAEY